MLISVVCRFHDDSLELVDDHYIDLGAAASAALGLADLHGDDRGNGHRRVKSFDVCVDGIVELSVTVFLGGLMPPSSAAE